MNGVSSLTQKGQVSIPKSIRDHFGLKTSDKIRFSIQKNRIIAEPALTTESMFGFIKAKRPISDAEMRKTIREAVVEKYRKKQNENRA